MCRLMESCFFSGHHGQIGKITKHMLILLAVCSLGLPAEAEYGGGKGEPENPYLIYTAEQMNEIGDNPEDWDKHFKLMADIDLRMYSGTDYNIIGKTRSNAFSGVFDGNGKKISNFTYRSTSRDYSGFFGYLKGSEVAIRNLGLIHPNIDVGSGTCAGLLVGYAYEGNFTNCYVKGGSVSGRNSVGGLIGYIEGGSITSCHIEGGRVSGNQEVGGLVGRNQAGIENCYSTCSVSGTIVVGGLVGENRGAKIAKSYATGRVSVGGDSIGGFVGDNSGMLTNCSAGGEVLGSDEVGGLVGDNSGTITNSCSSGNISGQDRIGGLVGQNYGVTINNCSATGIVSGNRRVGGLVGINRGSAISNCYATGIISGVQYIGGLVGVNSTPWDLREGWLRGRIAYCYAAGGVIGTTDVGGLVGFNDDGDISTSFWDVQTSGQANLCGRQEQGTGCDDSHGKTMAEMQTESTFIDAGWDFVAEIVNGTEDFWSICERMDYPKLASQFILGDFDGDNRVELADYAVFAGRWMSDDSNFFWCRGADLTYDGNVDFSDLKDFVENWLADDIGSPVPFGYIIIDDFESYNDLDPNNPESHRIFDAWLDGFDNPETNGSVVGYAYPSYTEHDTVHGGEQSIPYSYNTFFKFSKAELTLSPTQDWTQKGIGVLSLWFYGDKSNAPSPMGVALNGGLAVYHDNPKAVQINAWTGWTIDLQEFRGVDLTNIYSIAICFGYQNDLQPGGLGKMFFDDIRLYWPK